jgi:hypothetical protein
MAAITDWASHAGHTNHSNQVVRVAQHIAKDVAAIRDSIVPDMVASRKDHESVADGRVRQALIVRE